MAKQFRKIAKLKTLQDYLSLTIGTLFLEEFTDGFLEGVWLGKNPKQVSEKIIEMHRDALKPLLEKNLFAEAGLKTLS